MQNNTDHRLVISIIVSLCLLTGNFVFGQIGKLGLAWNPRHDLNILMPTSVQIFENNGSLPDGARLRAMYAVIDLRDDNLKLRAVGSNTHRETTLESYQKHNAILAINGGYFSNNKSESLLVSDGELIAPGPTNFTRGAFGIVNGEPQIVWPYAFDSLAAIFHLPDPSLKKDRNILTTKSLPWHPTQAVGGGPVLIKHGKIKDTSQEEGFGGSHLMRHPRTAIGYIDKHTLLLMVVDGRQPSSAGVTIKELAQIMFDAGCYEAVNLDGGGSSAMIAANEVVNIPTDIPNGNRNSLRKNASALVLAEKRPTPKKDVFIIDTESEAYGETGIWKNTNHANFYGATPSREALTNSVNRAVYQFTNIKRDSFQLSAWWTVSERSTGSATFVLHHGRDVDTIKVDQTALSSSGRWNVLGNYFLSPGDYIEVRCQPGQEKLITDAIRLIRLGNLQENPPRGDLRVAVISDLNSGLGNASYEWQVDSIIQRIPRCWRPDLVLCGGDMVAGMGVSDTATLTKMWNGFDEHIAKPLRQNNIPFAFTIGNHDGLRSYPSERKAIQAYWKDPDHQTGLAFVDKTHFPHYYSFLIHQSFFVSWDASASDITEENLTWLSEQFDRPEAKNARFRFVVGHLPLYSVAQERDSKGNVLEHAEKLRKLLEKYDVGVYISGHQHAYYPGKRGHIQLLNCGAAGSGPRRWLTLDKHPINTITIMDVFYEKDTIVYTTYDIKHTETKNMPVIDYRELPSSITGVNGFLIRNDTYVTDNVSGVFFNDQSTGKTYGTATVVLKANSIMVTGSIDPEKKLVRTNDAITFRKGKHTEPGEVLFTIPVNLKRQKRGTFAASFVVDGDMAESMSVGSYHILVKTEKSDLRAQLYPVSNNAPEKPVITSHHPRNTYGIRNSKALYQLSWTTSRDKDGDFVSYTYQLASDSLFNNIVFQKSTGRVSSFKKAENEIYGLLDKSENAKMLFHRVVAFDGKHMTPGDAVAFKLIQTDEPLTDFMELDPEEYVYDGKIENASGQGAGALWDQSGNLWLADYSGFLHVKLPNGENASFSPIKSVTVNDKSYSLKPINGIGPDVDGNVLVGSNRHLIKINARTGEGIAVWEAPEGKRAITTPRVNDKGEVYAMSLFAEDPNYVLRQSKDLPGTFELIRTINLPQRILARTFDMDADGLTLYFPDPGSAVIQTFASNDGITYKRGEDITSTAAGCNAVRITNNKVFAAVRPSGVSGATLHFRDESKKVMWTLALPDLDGTEARGVAVSDDLETVIICGWDKGGGFYRYRKVGKR